MEEAAARKVRFGTLQVVGAVAVIHLVVGVAELLRFASAGLLARYLTTGQLLAQPTPLLFTLSGLAILGGVLAVGLDHLDYRLAYALGMAVMAVFLVGWLAWHSVFDHGVAGPSSTADTTHQGFVNVVASHYVGPLGNIFTGGAQPGRVTLAVISKTIEVVAIALLAVLYLSDPRVEEPENPVAEMAGDGDEAAEN